MAVVAETKRRRRGSVAATALFVVAAVVVLAAVVVVAAPAAAAGTKACPGSLTENGRYRTDERGLIRAYYIRGGSCTGARKLLRNLDRGESGPDLGRKGTIIMTVHVAGGSSWKCRTGFIFDGKRRSFFGFDPRKTKVVLATLSCRPTTGRRNRRVTARTANIKDMLVKDAGGSS